MGRVAYENEQYLLAQSSSFKKSQVITGYTLKQIAQEMGVTNRMCKLYRDGECVMPTDMLWLKSKTSEVLSEFSVKFNKFLWNY